MVGGYRFDANDNLQQKNYPTVGGIPGGANVESPVRADLVTQDGQLTFILKEADVTTAERIAERINATLGSPVAHARDATAVQIRVGALTDDVNHLIARIESLKVVPDQRSRVVINERTGTVVAGGDVQVSSVVVAQGDIKISVTTEFSASQPSFIGNAGPEVRSLVVANTKLAVNDNAKDTVMRFPSSTVADLVQGLSHLHVGTHDIIAILQAIKAAGALYADIIVQ